MTIELTENTEQIDKEKAVSQVVSNFKAFDTQRLPHKQIMNLLRPKLYLLGDDTLKYYERKSETKDDWKSKAETNVLYSLSETFKAFLKENSYKELDNLFDVDGENNEVTEQANIQKQFLVKKAEEMGLSKTFDKAIEHFMLSGEVNLFCKWTERYKIIKRNKDQYDAIVKKVDAKFKPIITIEDGLPTEKSRVEILSEANERMTLRVPEYIGADVEAIHPMNIVYDSADLDNPHCLFVIKSWENPENVINNDLYDIDEETKTFLKTTVKDKKETNILPENVKFEEITQGDKVEVLSFFGDVTVDGKFYHNWSGAIVGRTKLILWEENRFGESPIIHYAPLEMPESRRGVPILYSIYGIDKIQNKLFNDAVDISSLRKNKPCKAPKGFFKEKDNSVYPGKITEYEADAEDPRAIIQEVYENTLDQFLMKELDALTSQISGIFPNMQGQQQDMKSTATEINAQVQGQTTRLQYNIDGLNKYGFIKTIIRVADLYADNSTGDETFTVQNQGKLEKQVITDAIRQQDYSYSYNDRSALVRQKANFQQILQLTTQAMQDPELRENINVLEMYKEGLLLNGIVNIDKLVYSDEEKQQRKIEVQRKEMQAQIQQLQVALQQAQQAGDVNKVNEIQMQLNQIMQSANNMQQNPAQMPQQMQQGGV